MSRQSTQPDLDPITIKMNMISTNITRIHSQNHKLQDLLEHRQHLNKLKDIANVSANNWKRLVTLSESVQKAYEDVTASKEKIHQSLSEHSDQLNKTVMADLQNIKNTMTHLENNLKQVQNRELIQIRAEIQKEKKKSIERIHKIKEDCFVLIEKAERQYRKGVDIQMEDYCRDIEAQFLERYKRCRISLGQLKNLIEYQHWKQHRNDIEEVPLSDIAATNFKTINRHLDDLQSSQLKVKSQVEWFRTKVRKEKSQNKSKNSRYEPKQIATLTQMNFSIEQCQQQLTGLDKICGEKSKKERKAFNQKEISQLIIIKQRISALKQKIQQHSSFYCSIL